MKVDIFFTVLVMRIRTQNFDIEDKNDPNAGSCQANLDPRPDDSTPLGPQLVPGEVRPRLLDLARVRHPGEAERGRADGAELEVGGSSRSGSCWHVEEKRICAHRSGNGRANATVLVSPAKFTGCISWPS